MRARKIFGAGLSALIIFGAATTADAVTLDLYNDDVTAASGGAGGIRGTVTCTYDCMGVVFVPGIFEIGGTGNPGTPGDFELSNAIGEVFYDFGSSGAATQLQFAEDITGLTFGSLTDDVDSASDGNTYTVTGDVAFLKIGNTPELGIIVNTSGLDEWEFSFSKATGAQGGLSNWFSVTVPDQCPQGSFACPRTVVNEIPLPAGAWLLLGGFGVMGVARRRRKAS